MTTITTSRARRSLFAWLRDLAESPTGPRLCFAWGFFEAFLFPIIPEFALAPLAFVVPRRAADPRWSDPFRIGLGRDYRVPPVADRGGLCASRARLARDRPHA